MSSETIGLRSIGQIAINVHDLERAVAFYRDALGMQFLFEAPPKMAFFDCDGIRLMLSLPERPEFDHPSSILYFRVDDIEAAHAAFTERGVAFEGQPHMVHKAGNTELWMAFLRDSEGNMLAMMSERG
jgi:methylmalonyl-CoA/ethylmalonyl-CoA epimerase